MSDPSTAPQERDQPGRLLLTGYAAEQVLWMVPLILGLVLFVVGGLLVIVWVGIIFVVAAVPLIRVIANRQRHIAGRVLGADLPPPYRPSPDGGPLIQLRTVLTDPMTWRDLAWILWAITFGWVISLLVIILLLALVTFFFWWFGAYPLLWMRSQVDRVLLTYGNTETLERRVEALTRSRAAAVDHSAAELRRLERDLHDGTQARLVAVSMSLGMAEELFASDPDAARRTVSEARAATTAAIADLRSVVRGIHPPVLADRGLDGAIRALALDMAVPVEVIGELRGRPPAPIESAVYFAVAECLANSAKHADHEHAWVELHHDRDLLRVVVGDDGQGGADVDGGTGMRGVMRRLAAFDGTMAVSSPDGGPTIVTLEVPCVLSLPKTTPSSAPV
ncbi:MAG TPA: sensor histidine kinase [Nocardioides bacterium]|uniref:sensor histidine kinase n=1 Tax=uncultured Nocardioides sp. TaxID=198441 RepID=UPI000ED0CA6B|nr:sensor domain-containing protein [uncultured Nocardioides sp.]HCB04779.1 sensor histidine kinase [Nocardioides sp.]